MTLGIAAYGPQAGAAVHQAVIAAELMGRGEIGGFAVFAILDAGGKVHWRSGQQRGITALDIPDAWLAARHAAVITSGPDRPEPLVQFLPGRDGVGMVTGHRLPNRPSTASHEPLNQRVVALMAAGVSAQAAVDQVLQQDPEADSGLIAVHASGQIGWANSARVLRRTDTGSGEWRSANAGYAFLHNAIQPQHTVTECVHDRLRAVLDRHAGYVPRFECLQLVGDVPVHAAAVDAVHVDAQWQVLRVETADPYLVQANRTTTLLSLPMPVWQNGRHMGHMATELFARVCQGVAVADRAAIRNRALVRINPA